MISFRKPLLSIEIFFTEGDYTAPPEENSYGNAECFLTADGLAGFSITERNWLVSLYSNQKWKGFLRMVAPLVERVIKLVCIVNEDNMDLVNAYENAFGFRIIARTIDDTGIMTEYYDKEFIDNFVQNYGHPDYVFMYRPLSQDDYREVVSFNDYFKAEKYVDREVV